MKRSPRWHVTSILVFCVFLFFCFLIWSLSKGWYIATSNDARDEIGVSGLRLVDGDCNTACEQDKAQKQYERDMGLRGRDDSADINRDAAQVRYERDMGLIGRYESEYAPAGSGTTGNGTGVRLRIGADSQGNAIYANIVFAGMTRTETDLYLRSLQKAVSTGAGATTRSSGPTPTPGGPTITPGGPTPAIDMDPVEVTIPVTGGNIKIKVTLAPKGADDISMTFDITCIVGTTAGNCTEAMLSEAFIKPGAFKDFLTELIAGGINVPRLLTDLTTQCVGKSTCSVATSARTYIILLPTSTPTPTTGTNATVPNDRVGIKLRVRPQGVITERELPYNKLRIAVSVGGGLPPNQLGTNTVPITNEFVSVGDGMFEGTVVFESKNLKPGKGYKIIVKAAKHLAKRFCDPEPNKGKKAWTDSYECPEVNAGVIELKNGLNSFDFSNVYLPSGDLYVDNKQNGVVDAADFTFIRKKLPSEDLEVLRIGDINMDGVLDTQDYILTITNLINNLDEK